MSSISEYKELAIANSLRNCRLFAGLPPEDLHRVAAITTIKPLGKGEYLFREGAPSQGFYIVQKGAINVHRVNAAGKEQVIKIFRTGESFAEATLASDVTYPADARAVEDSQVLMVQRTGFVELLRRHPELPLRMLAAMSMHLRVLVAQLEDLTVKDVETRLAHWLIKRCPEPEATEPVTIELTATKRMLAAELGTISETFSRTLAKFREQGLLEVKGKLLVVRNPSKLKAMLGDS
jgi:CRP/FNR family transcriptional regulator